MNTTFNSKIKNNTMGKIRFLMAGDNVLVDKLTGKTSIIGLFNELKILKDNNVAVISFVVVSEINLEPKDKIEKGEIKIQILKPDGTLFKEESINTDFRNAKDDQHIIMRFNLVKFEIEGKYGFKLILNGKELDASNYLISVKKILLTVIKPIKNTIKNQ